MSHTLSKTESQRMPKIDYNAFSVKTMIPWVICTGILIYIYRVVLYDLWEIWTTQQDYGHGLLVAPLAVYLVWRLRDKLRGLKAEPSLLGILLIVMALVLRVAGLRYWFGSLERYSFVVAIWGLVLLLSGTKITRRIIGPLLFLLLMIPLPNRAFLMVTMPLQRLATYASALSFKLMGWNVSTTGNVIRMYGQDMEVAAACNGLRMIFAIVTLGIFMAYLSSRPVWERVTVAVASVFVGLAVNVMRIVVTGIIAQLFLGRVSLSSVHDAAGWMMMPMALAILWGLQAFLRYLFIEDTIDVIHTS